MNVPSFFARQGFLLAFLALAAALAWASIWVYEQATISPLERARALVEEGRLPPAIHVLERSVEADPSVEGAHEIRFLLASLLLEETSRSGLRVESKLDRAWSLLQHAPIQQDGESSGGLLCEKELISTTDRARIPQWAAGPLRVGIEVAANHETEERLSRAAMILRSVLRHGGPGRVARSLAALLVRQSPANLGDAEQLIDDSLARVKNEQERAAAQFLRAQLLTDAWIRKVRIQPDEMAVLSHSDLRARLLPSRNLHGRALTALQAFIDLDRKVTPVPDRARAHLLRAQLLLVRARNERTLSEYNLRGHEPGSVDLERTRARIEGHTRRALAEIPPVLALETTPEVHQEALLLQGELLRSLGDYAEAEATYARIIAKINDPERMPETIHQGYQRALLGMARLGLARGDLLSVERGLAQLANLERPMASTLVSSGRLYGTLLEKRIEDLDVQTQTTTRRLESLRRPQAEIDALVAKAHREQSDYEKKFHRLAADRLWQAAVQADPALEFKLKRNAAWEAAQHLRSLGNLASELQALNLFLASVEPGSQISEALYRAGNLASRLGLAPQAISFHQRNIEAYPETPWSYRSRLDRAAALLQSGQTEASARAYQTIIDTPNFSPRSDIWQEALFALAKLRYRQALAQGPPPEVDGSEPDTIADSPPPHREAKRLYLEALGRYGPDKIVPGPVDSRSPRCQFRLAVLALLEDQPSDALEHLALVVSTNPKTRDPFVVTASYVLGDVRARLARRATQAEKQTALYQKAIRDYENASRRFPEARTARAWAYHRIGRSYLALGDQKRAERFRARALAFYQELNRPRADQEDNGSPDPFASDYWLQFIRWTEEKDVR